MGVFGPKVLSGVLGAVCRARSGACCPGNEGGCWTGQVLPWLLKEGAAAFWGVLPWLQWLGNIHGKVADHAVLTLSGIECCGSREGSNGARIMDQPSSVWSASARLLSSQTCRSALSVGCVKSLQLLEVSLEFARHY